jgi:hypothetical protein
MQNPATVKRIKIIVAYLILFVAVFFVIHLIVTPAATCTDKMQNQGEKGVDCGGPCSPCKEAVQTKDLSVVEVAFTPGGNNTYDVVAKISNPNDAVGAKSFNYIFTLKDASGGVVATSQGTSFILPADTRYVAQLGLIPSNGMAPASVDIAISSVQWEKLVNIGKPQIGVYSKKFSAVTTGIGSEAGGTIRNESSYDLKEIDAIIVLRDEKGKVVGINTTQRDSVRPKEQQDFNVTWPYSLENVQKIEVDTQTNVFDPQNFSVAN